MRRRERPRRCSPRCSCSRCSAIWELYARLGAVDAFILPAPTEVAQALWDDRGLLWDNLLVTAQEVGLGVLAALVLGFGLAVALHFSASLRRGTYPLLVASQAVPIVIIAPLLVVWFGFGIVPKLAIIALVCFFPVVVTTLDALAQRRPRPAQAPAHAGRLALAGVPLRRGARRAARRAERGEDRRRRRGHRRRLRRVRRVELRARPPHAPGDPAARDRRARTPPWCCSPRSPSPSSPPSRWPSAGWCRGPTADRKDPAHDADPSPDLRPARRRLRASALAALRREAPSPRARRSASACALMLDFFPNADHAGLYAAQGTGASAKAGLDVALQAPSDPSAPLKLLAAGQGRPGDLLRARAAARPRQGPAARRGRRARAEAADVGHVDRPQGDLGPQAARGQDGRHRGHPVPVGLSEGDPRPGRRRPRAGQGGQRRLQPRAGDALRAGSTRRSALLELRGRAARPAAQAAEDHPHGEGGRARPTTSS